MEFPNRESCVTHYMGLYLHLPKYIVEVALDYNLNKVKPTGAQKRALNAQRQRNADEHEMEHAKFDPNSAVKIIKRVDDPDCKIEGSIVVDEIHTQNLDGLQTSYIEEDNERDT